MFGLLAQDLDLAAKAKFCAFYRDSELTGAAWRYPSGLIGMSDLSSETIESLIDDVLSRHIDVSAVFGSVHTADTFRDMWERRSSVTVAATIHQRIYQIESVIYPTSVSGEMFLARPDYLELIADWNLKFSEDCGMTFTAKEAPEKALLKNIRLRRCHGQLRSSFTLVNSGPRLPGALHPDIFEQRPNKAA